jgi:rare lipoprotein A
MVTLSRSYGVLALALLLTACGSSHRPVYSGHEESTEGVPGFVDGKKTSPYVKLGQSYSVDGEEYVPRYQPDYVEEGLASWYGPGFHGGKTANGESYDKHDFTAAHRTLPLPSIVRVTMLDTGKSVYVRINDRGPFAKGRIIDLSYAAAKEIGLVAKGVARVRVEYMPKESQRFTDLLSQGREPQSIDMASEVLDQEPIMEMARAEPQPMYAQPYAPKKPTIVERLSPIGTAHADEPDETYDAAEVQGVSSTDLAPPPGAITHSNNVSVPTSSPFAVMSSAAIPTVPAAQTQIAPATSHVTAIAASPADKGELLQLGAFAQQENAERLRKQVAAIGNASIESRPSSQSGTLYLVRMGPYSHVEESTRVLDQLRRIGLNPKVIAQ